MDSALGKPISDKVELVTSRILHVLTPLSQQTPASLVEESKLSVGDLIADFRQFPFAVYELQADQTYPNITGTLFAVPDYEAVARKWLIQFTAQTGLQDILAVEGHGLWWTQNSLKFRPSLSDLGNSFAWIDLMVEIDRHVQPPLVIIYGQHTPIIHLARQIYQGVTLQVQPEANTDSRRIAQTPRKLGLLFIIRILLGIIYLIYASIRRTDICFFSASNLLRNTATGPKQKLSDIYLDDVAHALGKQDWRTTMIEIFDSTASWKGLMARGFFFPNDILSFSSSSYARKLGVHRSIVQKWHQKWLDIQPHITSHLQYRGYDIAPLALPLLAHNFTHLAPYCEIMTQAWRRVFQIWHPSLIFINCSYMLSTMAAIIAARSLNIPTIEQQHGVIGKNHMAYLAPQQLKPKTRFPLCDKMIVWGEFTRRLLVKAGVYELEDIAVCGFPRIDALLGTLPPRSQTLAQLGIPSDAQVALYTSGVVARDFWPAILDSIKNGPDSAKVYWIIKLHPRDPTRSKWETGISQRQIKRVKVVKGEFDFYALLAACDIHISFISTTLIESAILGKPNLGLAVPYIPDPVGYAEAKGFLPVAPNQLGTIVHNVLHDPFQKERLLQEQKEFADDWCLHDGKAIQRIVRFVEATIENQITGGV